MMAAIDRTIGRLEKSIETLETLTTSILAEMEILKTQRNKAAGALRAVMIMGAVVSPIFGAIGALIIDQLKAAPPALVEKLVAEVHNVDSN
jgi:hypothetical protein